MNQTTTYRFRQ